MQRGRYTLSILDQYNNYKFNSKSINSVFVSVIFLLLLDCIVKDDDACLQNGIKAYNGPYRYKDRYVHAYDPEITCESWKKYCKNTYKGYWYTKDVHRCCPVTCQTGALTEIECHALDAYSNSGKCIYPNEAQCYYKGGFE